jgi:hypothetical protein
MDPNQDWDDALADLPPGWRLGALRFYPATGDWQACAETFDALGCVMGVGPDSATAMLTWSSAWALRPTPRRPADELAPLLPGGGGQPALDLCRTRSAFGTRLPWRRGAARLFRPRPRAHEPAARDQLEVVATGDLVPWLGRPGAEPGVISVHR